MMRLVLTIALIGLSLGSQAHMMVAQHGTLNVVGDGVFMVLSLPASAFEASDDDQNGKLSMDEFSAHRREIAQQIERNVVLSDDNGNLPLQGIMLSPVFDHHGESGMAPQIIVTGRFALERPDSPLRFEVGLYGSSEGAQLIEMTATRQSDKSESVFELTPRQSAFSLFSAQAAD